MDFTQIHQPTSMNKRGQGIMGFITSSKSSPFCPIILCLMSLLLRELSYSSGAPPARHLPLINIRSRSWSRNLKDSLAYGPKEHTQSGSLSGPISFSWVVNRYSICVPRVASKGAVAPITFLRGHLTRVLAIAYESSSTRTKLVKILREPRLVQLAARSDR